jgi:hypothetical protein
MKAPFQGTQAIGFETSFIAINSNVQRAQLRLIDAFPHTSTKPAKASNSEHRVMERTPIQCAASRDI